MTREERLASALTRIVALLGQRRKCGPRTMDTLREIATEGLAAPPEERGTESDVTSEDRTTVHRR